MTFTRRATLSALLSGTVLPRVVLAAPRASANPVALRWIDGAIPALDLGQTVGAAWPRGALRHGAALGVRDAAGRAIPSQHWTTATWPDGSLKWTAHALPAGTDAAAFTVAPGRPAPPAAPVRVFERADAIVIRSGPAEWTFARGGDALVRAAHVDGRLTIGAVRLVGSAHGDPAGRDAARAFTGRIERVTVEQRGPVRAVVRIDGRHVGAGELGERLWLPFTVRCYVHAGSAALRIVHSVVLDGDPARDFLSGLGIAAEVPMTGAPHDRHLRIATDGQPFAEAVRPLTGLRRDPGAAFRTAQAAGRAVPPPARMAPGVRDALDRIPTWSDVTLTQGNANGFTIAKRTAAGHAWVPSAQGRRAPGLAYVGTPDGGAAIGQRWFWQRHPSGLSIRDAASDTATLTAWLHSPDAAPLDLRPWRGVMGMDGHDAQNEGLDLTYEDYEPGWDDARGIARTSEVTLWALPATPAADAFAAMAAAVATPPRLMAAPASLRAAGVFGDWTLPDRSTPARAAIEDQLANLVDFYAGEVDRRNWYGFLDHGDVMHTYDADRHQWRYDIGGFAWDNSELSTDLWLWLQALRTGDATTFRLAEAMTRHTSEVDAYHLGRFAGLGTRHGVQHWSDSSKQPRITTAAYRRIFYYLTADERTGDLMRGLLGSEERLRDVVIERKVPGRDRTPPPAGTIDMSFGTVWCSLAAAWLTEWERTGDPRWRDRLVAGMDSIGRLPRGWLTGSAPYDPASGRFLDTGPRIALSHLNAVFGAVEINTELLQLLDVPRYRAAWLDYCRWYNAPDRTFARAFGTVGGKRNLRESHSRLTAYAARATGDAVLANRAAEEFLSGDAGLGLFRGDPRTRVNQVIEWPGISTNAAAQWSLAAIQTLALVPDALESAFAAPPVAP